jgi:hypothetical protein
MTLFLTLLPSLFGLITRVLGNTFTEIHRSSIIDGILGLGSNLSSNSVMGVIKSVLGNIEDSQLLEIKAHVETLLAQVDAYNKSPEGFLNKGWRPTLAWGLSVIVLFHLSFCELLNVLAAFNIYTPGSIAPLNTITVTLIFGLLGIYTAARTVEKVNSNQDN